MPPPAVTAPPRAQPSDPLSICDSAMQPSPLRINASPLQEPVAAPVAREWWADTLESSPPPEAVQVGHLSICNSEAQHTLPQFGLPPRSGPEAQLREPSVPPPPAPTADMLHAKASEAARATMNWVDGRRVVASARPCPLPGARAPQRTEENLLCPEAWRSLAEEPVPADGRDEDGLTAQLPHASPHWGPAPCRRRLHPRCPLLPQGREWSPFQTRDPDLGPERRSAQLNPLQYARQDSPLVPLRQPALLTQPSTTSISKTCRSNHGSGSHSAWNP